MKVGSDTDNRNPGSFFQHPDPRIQNGPVSPELVDYKSLYHLPLVFFQELNRSDQLRKNAATVNVTDQKNRRTGDFRHSHINETVGILQIDFRRASGALNHDDIVLRGEGFVSLSDLRDQVRLIAEIFPGIHVPQDLPVYDDLRSGVIRGL